jgi:hypothetical protein
MPDYDLWATATLVSFVVADAIVLYIAYLRPTPNHFRQRIGWILGPVIGFYAGCALLDLAPSWPVRADRDRFLIVLLPLTLLVEVVAAFSPEPRWWHWLPRLSLAGVAAPILLHHSVYVADLSGPDSAEWPPAQRALILVGLAALLASVWLLLSWLQARTAQQAVSLSLTLSCLAAGLTVMLSGSLTSGLVALPMAGALAGATLASFFVPAAPGTNRCLGIGLVGLFSVLVSGRFFAALPTSSAIYLLLAPLLAWLPECPGVRKLHPGIRAVLAVSLVMIPLVIVVLNAKKKFDEMGEI